MNGINTTEEIKPMVAATPAPRKIGGQKGGSAKTIARREQLKSAPGQWFLWKTNAKTGGDTGQALRTLVGTQNLKGIDRKSLPYESTARINDNRSWDIYVRYVGEQRQYA
jgi:hypothetical protein